jgi:hypothetical protein
MAEKGARINPLCGFVLSVLYMKDGICIAVSFLVNNFNIICRIKHIN